MWNHYKDIHNKLKIVKHLKNRETAILTPTFTGLGRKSMRDIRVHTVKNFDFMLKWAGINEDNRPINIYHSLAVYKEGVPFGWKMSDRKDSDWNKHRIKDTVAYDFVVDIDSPTHNEIDLAKEDAIKLYDIMKNYNPSIRFSGKGFHIYIKYEDMLDYGLKGMRSSNFDPNKDNNIYHNYFCVAKAMHDTITEMIDLSIYDSRRLIKCPNTLAFYSPKDIYLCKELTFMELENFKLEKYKIKAGDEFAKEKNNNSR